MNINDPKFHPVYADRNTTLEWWGSDNKNRFNENLKTKKSDLEKNGWLEKEITYSINSEGFRCPQFDNNDCVMFLGKSVSIGIGLEYERIYPTLVSKVLGLRCANLSIAGTSNDTSFRMALHWIGKLKPKILVFDSEAKDRVELLSMDSVMNFVPSLPDTHPFYLTHLSAEENSVLNYKKNLLAIIKLCDINQTKFVEVSTYKTNLSSNRSTYELKKPDPASNQYARDLIHPGNFIHFYKALDILDMINE
jgi:hypothetical protein